MNPQSTMDHGYVRTGQLDNNKSSLHPQFRNNKVRAQIHALCTLPYTSQGTTSVGRLRTKGHSQAGGGGRSDPTKSTALMEREAGALVLTAKHLNVMHSLKCLQVVLRPKLGHRLHTRVCPMYDSIFEEGRLVSRSGVGSAS